MLDINQISDKIILVMRTKGSVGSIPVRLESLNKILKPNAEVLVSKRFYDAIALLMDKDDSSPSSLASQAENEDEQEEQAIPVQTL